MKEGFDNRDLLSIQDLSKEEILLILEVAKKLKKSPASSSSLQGKLMASCFFEPSTRTRLSFEAAMKRLGGDVIGFSDVTSTSVQKGESLHDSMKVIGGYADVVVLRHPQEGSARWAAESTETPIINAGDGANEHPTQTLLDLFTIQECQGTLDGLNIAFMGDLYYGRTVHSLVKALFHFNCRLFFLSPSSLRLPNHLSNELRLAGTPFSHHENIEEIIERVDILYMTRFQKERVQHFLELERVKEFNWVLNPSMLSSAKNNLRILHPLPRNDEIHPAVDKSPFAYYFEQAGNGLFVRQALLLLLLKGKEFIFNEVLHDRERALSFGH